MCTSKKRHFDTEDLAAQCLAKIMSQPPDPGRLYHPTYVVPCRHGCGRYVLTSREPKSWKAGRTNRNGVVYDPQRTRSKKSRRRARRRSRQAA